ncbi:MAG: Preprotein translocase subunit SecE (TC 3.A.5.1.1) [uncultured Sulfurovum sp.]|uniref:Protein translocase subunit SecE n=1 Tax=uncultured Sulfurovum sp. TaxID=269237 RepID=A0A6S6SYZ6_9BACT|nr:MAG: Preprotein translocase subunit SecE (TC 3.A.5.1.1) [uncultured Sulfurovum sp.]
MVEHWSPKPGAVGSSPSWPATKKVTNMGKFSTFIANAKAEIHKVIFPTKIQVRQAFFAVILVVTVISIFLALVDLLMSSIVSSVL